MQKLNKRSKNSTNYNILSNKLIYIFKNFLQTKMFLIKAQV